MCTSFSLKYTELKAVTNVCKTQKLVQYLHLSFPVILSSLCDLWSNLFNDS